MSKITKAKKREKRVRVPAEYTEGALHFKTGEGWKACYDGERDLYMEPTRRVSTSTVPATMNAA